MSDTQLRRTPRGEKSRKAILREAARLATVEGIEGLSISRLAGAVGMSKSGLFAHFGSKQELQLATIEAANELFDAQIVAPATRAATGLERLRRLLASYLEYVEVDTYPGGCFFASIAAEMDTHPGPVRDRALEFLDGWLAKIGQFVREAQAEGAIDAAEDPAQLVFELESYVLLANMLHVAGQGPAAIERAHRAIDRRLASPTNPRSSAESSSSGSASRAAG
jgi:AcrR family transcriptional regulator